MGADDFKTSWPAAADTRLEWAQRQVSAALFVPGRSGDEPCERAAEVDSAIGAALLVLRGAVEVDGQASFYAFDRACDALVEAALWAGQAIRAETYPINRGA